MNKKLMTGLLAAAVLFSCSACASVFEEEYEYSVPYSENSVEAENVSGADIKTYSQLKNAITAMVSELSAGGELRFNNYSGSVSDDMAAACYEIKTQTPMGAYAVDSLNYTLNRIVSYYTAEIHIEYKHSAEEVAAISSINGVSSLKSYLLDAVSEYADALTFRMYSAQVNEEYIRGIVDQAYLSDPLLITEPSVRLYAYPNDGSNRIYEMYLDYRLEHSDIIEAKSLLTDTVDELCTGIDGERTGDKALSCARILSAYCAVVPAGKVCNAYSALVERSSDSRGVAMAYAALCGKLGIDCRTVQGSMGTLGAETHYWNIIGIDGDYYHVDVSRFASDGESAAFLLSDEQAWGAYLWDSDEYPECSGELSYADFVAELPAENEQPTVNEPTEATGQEESGEAFAEEESGTEAEPETPEEEKTED